MTKENYDKIHAKMNQFESVKLLKNNKKVNKKNR